MVFRLRKPKGCPEPKKAPKTNGVCVHDWEQVDSYSWKELLNEVVQETYNSTLGYNYLDFTYRGFAYWGRQPEFMKTEMPKQKVCLKCGQCFNGAKEGRRKILTWLNGWADAQQEKVERHALAKKLWNDRGCDHADG